MTDPHLRIGPFARASSLSVKALRAYHEQGLLVPAAVDPATGYRSYSPSQLADAAVIRRLRHLDVPLADIRTVLDARDPEVTAKVLAQHATTLEARLAELEDVVDELFHGVAAPEELTPVHTRAEPATTVLAVPGRVPAEELGPFLVDAGRRLLTAATADGAVVTDVVGACFPTPEDEWEEATAVLPVAEAPLLSAASRAAGVRVAELAATPAAVLVHHGDYARLEDAYRVLGTWVAEHAEPTGSAVRERYLVTPADVDDPADLRTEISWPVAA
jgi:DNA-binding transcriptional MerR regulator